MKIDAHESVHMKGGYRETCMYICMVAWIWAELHGSIYVSVCIHVVTIYQKRDAKITAIERHI